MKIIRSKVPVTYGDRSKKTGIVAIVVKDYTWQEKFNRYQVEVEDCEVIDAVNPEPGTPLKSYPVISRKTVIRTKEQVNELFNYFAVDIVQGDDFTAKLRELIVKGLLLDTQQLPVYGTTAEDWEIVDTSTEIAPE